MQDIDGQGDINHHAFFSRLIPFKRVALTTSQINFNITNNNIFLP